jgi:hypothetical protein
MSKTGRLGDVLVSSGVITQEQLGEALRHQERVGGRLGTNLVELGFLDERALAGALAKQLSIPSVSQAQLEKIAADVTTLIPGPLAARLRVIPLRLDNGRLWVTMSDPSDKDAVDEVARLTKKPVRVTVAPDRLIQDALERYYKVAPQKRHAAPEPLGGIAVAAPIDIPIDEEVPLDDTDLSMGYLDDADLPPPPDLSRLSFEGLMLKLSQADSDNSSLDLVLQYLGPSVTRACALVLRNGELSGWRGHNVDMARMLGVRAALNDLPLFRQALDSGKAIVGSLESTMLGVLAAPMGVPRMTPGLLLPVRVGCQPVGVVLAVGAPTLLGQQKQLDKLVARIDYALHILHLRRLLLAP